MSETITVPNTVAGYSNNRKNIIKKTCTPFTNCISETNNAEIDNAKANDIVILMCSLKEYSIIIPKHLKLYEISTEMNYFKMLMMLLLILLFIIITVLCLNLKLKYRSE